MNPCKQLIAAIVIGLVATTAIAVPKPDKVRVATWNLFWFFDHDTSDNSRDLARQKSAPSKADYQWKLNAVADAIAEMDPTILALQEIENEKVVRDIARRLKSEHKKNYVVVFEDGRDFTTEQDVAILAKSGFKSSRRIEMPSYLLKKKHLYKMPSKHLVAEFAWGEGDDEERLTVIVVHFIASGGVQQRMRQGRAVRREIRNLIEDEENVIVLGDFNIHKELGDPTTKDSGVGIVSGLHTSTSDDDMYDLHNELYGFERETHRYGGHLDRILISPALSIDYDYEDLLFDRMERPKDLAIQGPVDTQPSAKYWKIPQDQRDHYPLVADFVFID